MTTDTTQRTRKSHTGRNIVLTLLGIYVFFKLFDIHMDDKMDDKMDGKQHEDKAKAAEAAISDKALKLALDNARFGGKFLRGILKDANSAQFKDVSYTETGTICGYINSRNSFGAYTGWEIFLITSNIPMIDEGSYSERTAMHNQWNKLCAHKKQWEMEAWETAWNF